MHSIELLVKKYKDQKGIEPDSLRTSKYFWDHLCYSYNLTDKKLREKLQIKFGLKNINISQAIDSPYLWGDFTIVYNEEKQEVLRESLLLKLQEETRALKKSKKALITTKEDLRLLTKGKDVFSLVFPLGVTAVRILDCYSDVDARPKVVPF